ncbi:MAG: YicC/YloC family endoribonuclease [Verrucomicrobiales bacterium]
MKSMTGYGRGEALYEGIKITAELTSVNRRQSEINVFLPRELDMLEPRVRNEVNQKVARGRINVKITVHAGEDGAEAKTQINRGLARGYVRALQDLAEELKIESRISLDLLVRIPGILEPDAALTDSEHLWPSVAKALDQALVGLVKMREKEGLHLAKDLKARISFMRKAVGRVKKEAPAMVRRYREQLQERIKTAGLPLPKEDDERLLKEIVYFADRSDISEELTRLNSHFKQFDDLLASGEPVGRTLDFLAQEMNREINTIGSKANDSMIAREVVGLKAELEKFREQVQNVE